MLDWIRHQAAVYRYGLGVLAVLAMFAFLWSVIGGLALYFLSWLLGFEMTGLGWLLATAAVAPFWLPDIAGSLGDMVKHDPPPSCSSSLTRAANTEKLTAPTVLRKRWSLPPTRS